MEINSHLHAPGALLRENEDSVVIGQEARWDWDRSVRYGEMEKRKSFAPAGNRAPISRLSSM
jgi:hypothetical protein